MIYKILIVEDDRQISRLYVAKLEVEKHLISQAYDGLSALKLCDKEAYDIILLDLRMPVMDGEKFLEKFRKKDSSTPIIILTNLSKEEAPKTLWHHGISRYFVKAHNTPKQLVEIINKVLNND